MVSVRPSAVSLQAGPVDYLDLDNPGNHEMLCNFIAKYVMKIYGVKMINDWLKKHKGQSFLKMMSMCDVAYCVALVQNSHEVWQQDKLVKRMSPEEQDKFRKWKKLEDPEERERYRTKEPKFSAGKGKKGYSVV